MSGKKAKKSKDAKGEDFPPLEELISSLRASNLNIKTKDYISNLLRELCKEQAKSTLDVEKLQRAQSELEETIIELRAKLENSQSKENPEEPKENTLLDNTMNSTTFRSGLNRSLPVLPLYQTSERMDDLTGQSPLRQSLQNENQRSGNHDDYSITTTQLANALAYALPDGLETPKKFNGTAKEAIEWIYHYENIAKGNNWSESKMIHKLPLYLTSSAAHWYELDIQGKENNLTWKEIKEKFYKQFLPENYHKYVKKLIRQRKQNPYESALNYIYTIRSLIQKTGIKYSEEQIVEKIIQGMLPQFKQDLIRWDIKTLPELQKQAMRIEQSFRAIHEEDELPEFINILQPAQLEKPDTPKTQNPNQSEIAELTNTIKKMIETFYVKSSERGTRTYEGKPKCKKCGRTNHATVNCRANLRDNKKPSCFYCQKIGHVMKDCRKKKYDDNEKQKQRNQQTLLQNNFLREIMLL